jgi:hypothetical protein
MKNSLKGITVPYKYYDKKENYTYYIYKNKMYTDMNKLFTKFIGSYLTYHYEIEKDLKEVHNLSEVIEAVLKNYKVFSIPDKYKKEYSTIELKYIKRLVDDLNNNKLEKPYEHEFSYSIKDFKNRKLFKFNRFIFNQYKDTFIPKKVRTQKYFKHDYYVVAGTAYQSIYHALDEVFDENVLYLFGGTKNPNNRTHQKARNFDDLVSLIFKKSTRFMIHVHQQEFYSKQELEFLQKLADKINELGFKSIEPKYEEEYTEEYNYLKDNHRYIGILLNNIKYNLKQHRYEKEVLKSHKI